MRKLGLVLGTVLLGASATALLAQAASSAGTGDSGQRKKLEFDRPKPLVMTRDLAEDATVVLDVNVGDVRIARNPAVNKIQLEIQTRRFDDEAAAKDWVRQFEVAGNRATIRLQMPKQRNGGAEVVVYVPARTTLKLDLGVGDLRISHVRGDKTLHVGIGDLVVGVEDAGEYGNFENKVKLGDVHDQVLHVERDGFFNQEKRRPGSGLYHLRASVGIGDLTIQPEDKL